MLIITYFKNIILYDFGITRFYYFQVKKRENAILKRVFWHQPRSSEITMENNFLVHFLKAFKGFLRTFISYFEKSKIRYLGLSQAFLTATQITPFYFTAPLKTYFCKRIFSIWISIFNLITNFRTSFSPRQHSTVA